MVAKWPWGTWQVALPWWCSSKMNILVPSPLSVMERCYTIKGCLFIEVSRRFVMMSRWVEFVSTLLFICYRHQQPLPWTCTENKAIFISFTVRICAIFNANLIKLHSVWLNKVLWLLHMPCRWWYCVLIVKWFASE